ncbi:hypothetical protein NITMOv2_0837 [Nitrospira moscoviensis]|uniref:Nucleotidyl transferase AbiEii/AbiGii toxin family protein n=1 Tax=Nitrospira moscoviensis TaxID=42253 RepID=A0A0K2G9J5_NITMO|nr:hypothetical protein NITMOv2_0837 [Nitrospira moscoviensis]
MFAELLERLAGALDQAHLPYMVIGGQAVLLNGDMRLTRDIDITLGSRRGSSGRPARRRDEPSDHAAGRSSIFHQRHDGAALLGPGHRHPN